MVKTSVTTVPTDASWTHRRIDLENWDDVYVIGDVHGCIDALEELLETLEVDRDDLAVFVGDLVRKGPDSRAVIERVRTSSNLRSVRGNNEQKLLDGEKSLPRFGPTNHRYLESMPVAISWDGGLVVHGGVDPSRELSSHTAEELLTMRSPDADGGYDGPFWFDRYEGEPRVFFGHTVLEDPLETDGAVGLDTGCVYGGALTAYDVRREEFVSIDTDEHQSRPAEKFVSAGVV